MVVDETGGQHYNLTFPPGSVSDGAAEAIYGPLGENSKSSHTVVFS